jgi:predicted GIY-YIG superfamily endonuclease
MLFWLYILRCANSSCYTGHTDNLEGRIAQHHRGEYPCYTHSRRPLQLVFTQDFATREEALASKRRIKNWSRAKKEALIRGDWEELKLAAKKDFGPPE